MEQNVGQAPSTKRSKRLAVKKINIKNKKSFSSLSKSSPTIQARVTLVLILDVSIVFCRATFNTYIVY